MDGKATTPYEQTGFFSRIVIDYIKGSAPLQPFYCHPPNLVGLKKAMEEKSFSSESRQLLVTVLKEQYDTVAPSDAVIKNIELLQNENTFTICTAHQPNLFTGPLYFIYKILHAIKLAEHLKQNFPQNHFVPVYYMGSEDADLEELNHFTVDGKKYEWKTAQTGAVGRMLVDNQLLVLIDELEGQLAVQPFGNDFISFLKQCFTIGKSIQQATFELVHLLFNDYGLIVLIPDKATLKGAALSIFEEELLQQSSSGIVEKTIERITEHYKVQAHPREINLFYLKDDKRERIVKEGTGYHINNTSWHFSKEEMLEELKGFPDRFSPNVILRGLFQETVLPNIAFIGGGGELAYWLQLKDLFTHHNTAFPVLILRNSFLIIEKKWQEKIENLQLSATDLFKPQNELLKTIVLENSGNGLSLQDSFAELDKLYDSVQKKASEVDVTLKKHVAALQKRAQQLLQVVEQKMLRAEKKKFAAQNAKIEALKKELFPNNSLQERVENIGGFYAKWGPAFIDQLYKQSPALEQEFTILYFDR